MKSHINKMKTALKNFFKTTIGKLLLFTGSFVLAAIILGKILGVLTLFVLAVKAFSKSIFA